MYKDTSRASYGVSFARILETIYRVITASHRILTFSLIPGPDLSVKVPGNCCLKQFYATHYPPWITDVFKLTLMNVFLSRDHILAWHLMWLRSRGVFDISITLNT